MKISTALDLLMDKGLLSEEDTFTIVRDNEAGSVSLQLKHLRQQEGQDAAASSFFIEAD